MTADYIRSESIDCGMDEESEVVSYESMRFLPGIEPWITTLHLLQYPRLALFVANVSTPCRERYAHSLQ